MRLPDDKTAENERAQAKAAPIWRRFLSVSFRSLDLVPGNVPDDIKNDLGALFDQNNIIPDNLT